MSENQKRKRQKLGRLDTTMPVELILKVLESCIALYDINNLFLF